MSFLYFLEGLRNPVLDFLFSLITRCGEETVFMALRMNQGLSKHLFSERFAKPAEAVFAYALRRCMEKGWIKETEEAYFLTEEGRVLGNLVFMEFIQ